MKKNLTIIFTFITFLNVFSQADVVNNESIIEMKKSNLSKVLILNSIENANNYNFDTSTIGLKQLSSNNVDDDIIVLIMNKQKNKNDNNILIDGIEIGKNEYGLFTIEDGNKMKINSHLTQVDFGMKLKAQIPNAKSDIQISGGKKIFYLNFGSDENSSTNSIYNLNNSISDPNEGELVRLTKSGNKRNFEVGKAGMGKIKSEIPTKIRIEYKVEKVKYNIYKITVDESLEAGEYGFIFGAINPGATMKIYDFSIK